METNDGPNKKQIVPTASAILDDDTIVEMVFRPDLRRTLFAIYSAGRWTLQDAIDLGPDARLLPFSANNNLIKNEVVLLPSEPRIYGSEAQLVADIRSFIHRYVDFGESFENVATHYVLLTWLYDAFNELPYLRLRGDYGSGKTRALLTIGSLCYKGFFASGASTVSPIFHTLNAFEAQVPEILAELMSSSQRPVVPVSEIAIGLIERYGSEYDRPITNRWVGSILRKRLNVRTYKSHGVYVVPIQERSKIELLCTRYGINVITSPTAEI